MPIPPILYVGGVYGAFPNTTGNTLPPGWSIDPQNGQPVYNPPVSPTKVPSVTTAITASPGLLTSTGGLQGAFSMTLEPFYDTKLLQVCFQFLDPANFDSEEDAFYLFPNNDVQTGRQVTIHKAVVVYREIGKASFFVGCTTYSSKTDAFTTKETPVFINRKSSRNYSFPDYKLHTRLVSFIAQGERPQPYIRRVKDSGPLSITEFMLCGHADEGPIL